MSICYAPDAYAQRELLSENDQSNLDQVIELLAKKKEFGWASFYATEKGSLGLVIAVCISSNTDESLIIVCELDLTLRH